MKALTEVQTINGPDGVPAFVVIPYATFVACYAGSNGLIPHAVVSATVDGASPMKAWREHLGLTQAEVATSLGTTQAAYAQTESAARPRRTTIQRVAAALGIQVEQLDF
ncbi:MAG: helix-turn-helix transcriptional regulator [Rhodanobacteraceae bacterium]|jgi:DNA-binding XRE family transcriptional regulator|nr:helix-turn-helix transcriptional regulator [Rhodanobacteraceae bacterium]